MIEVFFDSPVFADFVDMHVIETDMDGSKWALQPNNDRISVEAYSLFPKPLLRLKGKSANELLKAIANAVDKKGIKTDSNSKIEGLLEATRTHLDDMRKLVFK
jgi:hypothetical protein